MKLFSLKNIFLLVCIVAPIAYLSVIYDGLPEKVAMHFGSDMKPDRYGYKAELWTVVGIIMGISMLLYLLITNVGKFDPKNQSLQSQSIMQKMSLTIVAFMSVLTIYIIYSSVRGESGNTLFVLLGGFFALTGNFIHSIKPNYFVGLRLPWTLENEDNWRKTHQFGGKVWVGGGLLIAVLSLLVTEVYMIKLFFILVLLMVLVPSVYSYKYYQKSK
jgi:uncharacterized membrane protein